MFNSKPGKQNWSFKDCTSVSVDQFEIYIFTPFSRSLIKVQMWTSQAMVRMWMPNNHELCLSPELSPLKKKNLCEGVTVPLQESGF